MHIKLKGFLKDVIGIVKRGEKTVVEDLSRTFTDASKNVVTGVRVFDECLGELASRRLVKIERGVVRVGDKSFGEFTHMMKRGDLPGIVSLSNPAQRVTSREIGAFETLVGPTPDLHVRRVEELKVRVRTVHADIDVAPSSQSLSAAGRAKITKIEKKFTEKYAGKIVYGSIGAVAVVAGTQFIADYVKKMKGCHMLYLEGGVRKSCKVNPRTCDEESRHHANEVCSATILPDYEYKNVALRTIDLLNNMDPASQTVKEFLSEFGFADIGAAKRGVAATMHDRYPDLQAFFDDPGHKAAGTAKLKDPCRVGTLEGFENGQTGPCRMFDQSALPYSSTYYDVSAFKDEVDYTFVCHENPTYLDAFADISVAVGENVLDFAKTIFDNLLKPFILVLLSLVALFAFLSFVIRVLGRSGSRSDGEPIGLSYKRASSPVNG